MMYKQMELLAPAGDMDIAKAAFQAGADACYIGGKWSARAYAKNFDKAEICEILQYAHLRQKKIYVALNTMLYDREMQEALNYTKFLYEAGVDAVIAADLGYISQVRDLIPGLPIHVSTQAGIQNAFGAQIMRKMGCARVVAARECSLANLADMAKQGIEIEAFCHGAMCSGVSGACLMSGMIGGRSGNRGRCAQPCRQEYILFGKKAYHLSTKDLCSLALIGDFARAGVASLKIEGRMKKVEYVISAVLAYRKAIDSYEKGQSIDIEMMQNELACIFNRGGFTQGYLTGGREVTYLRKPSHMGLFLGKLEQVKNGKALVRTQWPLQKGDSIELGNTGFSLAYADAEKGGWRIAVPKGMMEGQAVYLKSSAEIAKKMQYRAKQNKADDRKKIILDFSAEECGLAKLSAKGENLYAEASCCVTQKAQKPMAVSSIREKLCKTGEIPFDILSCHIQLTGDPFLPASMLNALRREVWEKLLCQMQLPQHEIKTVSNFFYQRPFLEKSKQGIYLAAQVTRAAQASAAARAGADRIYVAPFDEKELDEICKMKDIPELWLVLPAFCGSQTEIWLKKFMMESQQKIHGFVVPNPGMVQLAHIWSKSWIADYWMNIANQASVAQLFSWGASGYAVSEEIGSEAIKQLDGPKEIIAYGYLPLMNLRHCPVKKQRGCQACGSGVLKDKLGYRFWIGKIWAGDCLAQVYNAVPIALQDMQLLYAAGITGLRLLFSEEDEKRTERIVHAYHAAWCQGQKINLKQLEIQTCTNGHFYRGVE